MQDEAHLADDKVGTPNIPLGGDVVGTPDPTDPSEPEGDVLWGDANCDGKVTIADSTAILQSIGNPDKYALSAQGALNGDVIDNKGGITTADAIAIKGVDAGIVKTSQFPMTSDDYAALSK
jgi:endoglucanase